MALCKLGVETRDDCVWNKVVIFNVGGFAIEGNLIADSIEDDHFAVKVDKCAQPEIPVTQKLRNLDSP